MWRRAGQLPASDQPAHLLPPLDQEPGGGLPRAPQPGRIFTKIYLLHILLVLTEKEIVSVFLDFCVAKKNKENTGIHNFPFLRGMMALVVNDNFALHRPSL